MGKPIKNAQLRGVLFGKLWFWQVCWWPFWDAENVTLSRVKWPPTRGIKRSLCITWYCYYRGCLLHPRWWAEFLKPWCLNPKRLLNGTLSHPFGTLWRVRVCLCWLEYFFSSGPGATASVSVTFASAPHSVTTTAEILHGQTGSVGPEDLRRPTVDGRNPAPVYR